MKPMPKFSFYGTLRKNTSFILLFSLWIILVSSSLLIHPKGYWVLYFSEHRTAFWNQFFKYGTQLGEEWALIGGALILLFVRFRAAVTLPLLSLGVLVTSGATKKLFHHPRPLRVFSDHGMADMLTFVDGVDVHAGPTSFPSGHTLAAFALYTFLALNIGWKNLTGVIFFLLAVVVGISRIYLVQHFLEDVYLGSVIGVALAFLFYYLQEKLGRKPWLDKRLPNPK